MLAVLCIFIVFYEIFRLLSMKEYHALSVTSKKLKVNTEAITALYLEKPHYLVYTFGELIYLLVIVIILFTNLVWLGATLLGLSLLNYLVSIVFKNKSITYLYLDSIVSIAVVVILYQILI